MAFFISTFITGFGDLLALDIKEKFPLIKVQKILDGLIFYKYDGNSRDLEKIPYFNNTFFVIKTWDSKKIDFQKMVNEVTSLNSYFLISKGTFRCRFIMENQFVKVDKKLSNQAEQYIQNKSKLLLDKVSPSTEVCFNIRRENFAFCGQLISKREFTENNLNKGELRPEIAYLMAVFAGLKEDDIVLDSFAGYGSIPIQIAKKFKFSQMYVSDIDEKLVAALSEKKQLKNQNIFIQKADALTLKLDKKISLVITDPPWGYYEDINDISDFYEEMLENFKSLISENARIVILSARKEELKNAAYKSKFQIIDSIDTLVNGKKAALYKLTLSV